MRSRWRLGYLGGDKGLGPPATLIGGYMVGSDQPPVTNQQQQQQSPFIDHISRVSGCHYTLLDIDIPQHSTHPSPRQRGKVYTSYLCFSKQFARSTEWQWDKATFTFPLRRFVLYRLDSASFLSLQLGGLQPELRSRHPRELWNSRTGCLCAWI